MNTYHVYTVHMNPVLNRSSALYRFECGSAIEGLMFNSYPRLPRAFPAYYFNSPAVEKLLSSKWKKKKQLSIIANNLQGNILMQILHCVHSIQLLSSITAPQDTHKRLVHAAGLSWLKHFRVQSYTCT